MKSDEIRLCVDFLCQVAGRSKGGSKRYMASLGPQRLDRLLRDALEWKEMGSPVREPNGTWGLKEEAREGVNELMPVEDSVEEVAGAKLTERRPTKSKKVMFSILLPPADLDALRQLSEDTGETMAYHVRTAIRGYLKGVRK